MEIDLRRYWLPLIAEVSKGLREFQLAHPDIKASTVGLFGDGLHGSASLHVDTLAHSAEFVRQWASSGSVLRDEAGQFCSNCPDFEYCLGTFWFKDYPDFYELELEDLSFIGLDGKAALVDRASGDAGKHQHVFPFLKKLIAAVDPFPGLTRSTPFRVGVQMIDNQHQFWVVDTAAGRTHQE